MELNVLQTGGKVALSKLKQDPPPNSEGQLHNPFCSK